jgi:hypothetical protein
MIRTFLTPVLVLVYFAAFSQDSLYRSSFIAVSVGANFATGHFADSKSNAEGSGFGTSGFSYQIELAGFWSRYTGFGLAAGEWFTQVNQNSFSKDFVEDYVAANPPTSGTKVTVENIKSWRAAYAMVGPYVSIPTKFLAIDFKAVGGFVNTKSPGFTITKSNPTLNPASRHETAEPVPYYSFGYILGTNIRLRMGPNTQLKFGIEYFQTYAPTGYRMNEFEPTTSRGTQSVSTLNLQWGIAFALGK